MLHLPSDRWKFPARANLWDVPMLPIHQRLSQCHTLLHFSQAGPAYYQPHLKNLVPTCQIPAQRLCRRKKDLPTTQRSAFAD